MYPQPVRLAVYTDNLIDFADSRGDGTPLGYDMVLARSSQTSGRDLGKDGNGSSRPSVGLPEPFAAPRQEDQNSLPI